MDNPEYNYLHFAKFSNLVNWSVSHLLGMNIGFAHRFPMATIGSVIERCKTTIDIDDSTQYKQITLKTNGGGAVLRDVKSGKNIGTKKQYVVSAGQFIMSKIDARNGAFGVVTEDLDGAIVTADFPVFNVDKEKIIPQYLFLLSTTKAFTRFAQSCSRGTTNRQRIDIDQFLSQRIPLPSLTEQNRLLSRYQIKVQQADSLNILSSKIWNEIDFYLQTNLGFSQQEYFQGKSENSFSFLKFVKYKDLDKWGFDLNQTNHRKNARIFPIKKVKDICLVGSGGTPSRSNQNYYGGNIPWVKTGEVINEEIFETEEHITQEAVNNSSARMYNKGSLIIAMYGQGETRGRTAKLGIDATTNQACAVLFDIDNSIILTDYLWYYMQCMYYDLRSLASGNNQPNLNAEIIKNYNVVIPPIKIQSTIVKHINEQKLQIKQLKRQAETLRKAALIEFEEEIFE